MPLVDAGLAIAPSALDTPLSIAIPELFERSEPRSRVTHTSAGGGSRHEDSSAGVVLDRFDAGTACAFVRIALERARIVRFTLRGSYAVRSCPAGGWGLIPQDSDLATYWVPCGPMLRRCDPRGRIVFEAPATVEAVSANGPESAIEFLVGTEHHLDSVIWRFPPEAVHRFDELGRLGALERQPQFMLASHTSLRSAGGGCAYF